MQADVEQREGVDMWMLFVGIFLVIGNDSQHLCVILNQFVDPLRQFWHHFGGLGTLMATLGPAGTPGRVQK